jgi:hypothetical protein
MDSNTVYKTIPKGESKQDLYTKIKDIRELLDILNDRFSSLFLVRSWEKEEEDLNGEARLEKLHTSMDVILNEVTASLSSYNEINTELERRDALREKEWKDTIEEEFLELPESERMIARAAVSTMRYFEKFLNLD